MMGQGDVVTAWTLALYIVTTAAGEVPYSKGHMCFADSTKHLLH